MTKPSDDVGRLYDVRLLGLPVAIAGRAQEHGEELLREFTLIAEQVRQEGGAADVPSRLVALVDEVTGDFSRFAAGPEAELARAVADGRTSLDLVYQVPASAGPAADRLAGLLAEADSYCRAGRHLLTLAAPPDVGSYQRWLLGQFGRQLGGDPPVAWADWAG